MTQKDVQQARASAESARARRRRRFASATLAIAVFLALILFVCVRQRFGLESQLAVARLGRLPDSAVNVMFETRRDRFGMRTTFIRFEAELDDIQKFIRDSTVSIESKSWMRPAGLPHKPSARRNPMLFLVNRPSWWKPPLSDPLGIPAVLGLSSQQPYIGGVIVDYSTDRVYIGLARPSTLSWFKQKLPFI